MTTTAPSAPPPPPPGVGRLITRPDDKIGYTANRECDARGALMRGLSEYLEQVQADINGRKLRFKKVNDAWADPEQHAKMPSVALYTLSPGTYDAVPMTPVVDPTERLADPDGRYVVKTSDFTQDIIVEAWAPTVAERNAIGGMLEDAFNPVQWRYGFFIELPYYFGLRGDYSLKDNSVPESDEDASKNIRKMQFTITASVPVVKLYKFPGMVPRFELQAVSSDSDVLVKFTVT